MRRIIHAGTVIADPGARNPAGDFKANGQRATDAARIVNASAVVPINRGLRETTIQFTLAGEKASLRAAQKWALGVLDILPAEGPLEIECGTEADGESVFFAQAVLSSATPILTGVRPIISLTYLAGKSSLTPADGGSNDDGDTSGSMRGIIPIPNGADSVAVAYASAFAAPPIIVGLVVEAPAGTDFRIGVDGVSSATAAGFLAEFSGAAPVAGFRLHYEAKPAP